MNPLKHIRLGPKAGWITLNAVMALVLLAGVTTSGWLAMRWWDNANRAEALDAAHDMLTKFLTVSPSTVDRDLVAVEEIIASDSTLADEWKSSAESVKEQVLAGGAERTPEIQSLAFVSDELDEEEDKSPQDDAETEDESKDGEEDGMEADFGTDENNAGPEIDSSDNAVVLAAVNTTTRYTVPLDTDELSEEELAQKDTDGDGYMDPVENRLRMRVNLAKVDGEWKMSQVQVST